MPENLYELSREEVMPGISTMNSKDKNETEELALYGKLQRLFGEKMGIELPYDEICCLLPSKSVGHRIDCDYACPEIGCFDRPCTNRIRLPLPIDPRNSKRGLVGMLKGISCLQAPEDKYDPRWAIVWLDGTKDVVFGDTPTLALLKALAEQEEGEYDK